MALWGSGVRIPSAPPSFAHSFLGVAVTSAPVLLFKLLGACVSDLRKTHCAGVPPPYAVVDSKGLMQVLMAASRLVKAFLFLSCVLVFPAIQATETILVGADAEWRYYSSQTPPPENWNAPAFDATAWSAGHAQLGYGDGDEVTVIPGGDLNPHPVAAYFRRSFSVTEPTTLSKLVFRLVRDDGAVIYLNGVEVLRSNMPDGAITPDTLAATTVGADIENQFLTYEVPATAL